MKLVDFYKKLVEGLGIIVGDDGLLQVKIDGQLYPIKVDKLPLYLPYDAAIKTAVKRENGKVVPVKSIFHPLKEDALAGTNKSFDKLKQMMELKIISLIHQVGEILLRTVTDGIGEDTLVSTEFASLLVRYKTPQLKVLVDEKTIEAWRKLFDAVTENYDKRYVKFYIKKGGEWGGVKYKRTGILSFPFLEELMEYKPKKDGDFLGVKLRNKDVNDFISIFELIFGPKEELLEGFKVGSLNKVAPSNHVLLVLYNIIYEKMKEIVDELKEFSPDEDFFISPLPIDVNTVPDYFENIVNEIKIIPDDRELAQGVTPTSNRSPMSKLTGDTKEHTTDIKRREPERTPVRREPPRRPFVPPPGVRPAAMYVPKDTPTTRYPTTDPYVREPYPTRVPYPGRTLDPYYRRPAYPARDTYSRGYTGGAAMYTPPRRPY